MRKTKLIVLRGPSGSGKSSAARRLFENAKHRIALIEQDHYRFIFNPPGGGSKPNSDTIHKMIKNDVLVALQDGYDVILEGILSVKSYEKVLDELYTEHAGENYMYYFDVSFDETVRRHQKKPNAHEFGELEMKEWYPVAHKSHHELEQVILESFSLDDTVRFILENSRLEIV